MSLAPGLHKSESAWKLLHITPIYVEFGATRACFMTTQGQETINRKIRNLENRNRRWNFNVCFMTWLTVLDLGIKNPSLILILQAAFDRIGFRAFYIVLERRFFWIGWSSGMAVPRVRFVSHFVFGFYNFVRLVLLFFWIFIVVRPDPWNKSIMVYD